MESADSKMQFRIELFLALIITGLACAAGFSNLLFAPSDFFPGATDFLGHMAKVRYLSESISQGEFPSWFPYWYNGSTSTQYYPPLSYWFMVPIFMVAQNVLLSFKINCFIMIFIGGIGVWYFCRAYIGKWCGLFGTVFFCLQPYILLSFYGAGLLAQGPVIALTPWYIIVLLSFSRNPNGRKFFFCTLLCTTMILSHPMTTFMICLCIMAVFLIFAILKMTSIQCYIYMGITIVFAGILTAFWSIVGVTGLENPGIPYLLGEAALNYTANIRWFTTLSSGFFYYAIPISIGSIIASLLFIYRGSKKETTGSELYCILFCILLTFITTIFSFGMNLPLFEYLPLAESYVPGRILSLTAVSGAILCAYLLFEIQKLGKDKKMGFKISTYFVCLIIIGTILFYMNPLKAQYPLISDVGFNQMFLKDNIDGDNFEKGRYAYICAVDCSETYFPLSYDFNITDGWNIEGTPHNRALWDFIIADPSGNYDFAAKYFAYWNVRDVLLSQKFNKVAKELNRKYDFQFKYERGNNKFYTSSDPSSYFLVDNRNALLLGAGSPGLAIEFPYLVYEQRNDIGNYSLDELEKYKLIYLCEPAIDTIQEKKNIEEIVEKLVNKGITVIIEPTITKGNALFDITVADVRLEDSPVIRKQSGSRINSAAYDIEIDESMNYGRTMFGLDEVYYKLVQNEGRLENDIVGTKKVGNGEVVFIGKHLSQYLKAVYARNWGVPENDEYPDCSDEVKALFEDIFKTYGVNTNFWPDPFPVKNADWNYKGVTFDYFSQTAREMTLSVTYAPRWKATIDGNPAAIGQKENLITLNLPAGEHQVKLVYGVTKYGIAGYVISLLGLFMFLLFLKFYDIILFYFTRYCDYLRKFLQL